MEAMFPETADIETASENYAQRFAGPIGQWLLEVQSKILLKCIRPEFGKVVLDVGGGHAQIARPLVANGYEVTVVGSANECSNRLSDLIHSGRCKFVVGNLINLQFREESYDIVTCFRLIPHCDDWPKLISELCRVSRHVVIVDYPTNQSVNFLSPMFFKLKKQIEKNTRTFALFSHREIREEFAKHGFELEARYGEFFFPMVLHRMLKSPRVSGLLEGIARFLGLSYIFGSPVILLARRMYN